MAVRGHVESCAVVLAGQERGQNDRVVALRAGSTEAQVPGEQMALGAAALAEQALTAAGALVHAVVDGSTAERLHLLGRAGRRVLGAALPERTHPAAAR